MDEARRQPLSVPKAQPQNQPGVERREELAAAQPRAGDFTNRRPSTRTPCDFTQSKPNPYASKLKKPVTIRLGVDVIDYFRSIAEETGIPYQTLINLYLRDCAIRQRKLKTEWAS